MVQKKKIKWRLGEILIQNGWVTWEHLTQALEIQEQLNTDLDLSSPVNRSTKEKKKLGLNLGEILIRDKSISWEDLEKALDIQRSRGGILGAIVVNEGFVTEENLYRALAAQGGFTYINFEKINVQPKVLEIVPKYFIEEHPLMPILEQDGTLLVAISDTRDVSHEKALQKLLKKYEIAVAVAAPTAITKAIKKYYS